MIFSVSLIILMLNDFFCFNIKNAFHCKFTLTALSGGERRKREIQSGKRERERNRGEECHVEVYFD